MILLDKLLTKLHKEGHKVLIFSQMTRFKFIFILIFFSMLDIVQDYMHLKNYVYERIDGSVRSEERNLAIKSFTDDDIFAFLLSTRAGGVGLNLVKAGKKLKIKNLIFIKILLFLLIMIIIQ